MLMLLTAYLFLLALFVATDQSITRKEKTKCIFSNPGNLPCASRKICSLGEVTVLQSKLSFSSETSVCREGCFTSTTSSLGKVWNTVADVSAGVGAVSVKRHSKDSEFIGN